MNTSIPTQVPQDVEKEMDIMFAQIEEMMANIRRNREEGAKIVAEGEAIRQSNDLARKELDEIIARWR